MPVNLHIPSPDQIFAVGGVRLGIASAGIKKAGRRDITLIELPDTARAAGVFTRNRFCAAPVVIAREHLQQASAPSGRPVRALVINTGNANAGTGASGLAHARETCAAVAARLGCEPEQVLPFSTGVILEPLPVDRIIDALDATLTDRADDHWLEAARAIMTTDTQPKVTSRRAVIAGTSVTVTGIAKGAGMIRPNMATMLSFIATDAAVPQALLQQWVREAADQSFNRITVDGDTSTNDSMILIATGQSLAVDAAQDGAAAAQVKSMIESVALELAQAIIRDGEGATKFITVAVEGAENAGEAAAVAYAVAHSPLVKTAFFASDPNLGRLLCAIGYAGIDDLDVTGVDVWLDDVHVATGGGRHPGYREEDGKRVMQQSEITVRIALGRGAQKTTVFTCDLSHDYVSINADYRS